MRYCLWAVILVSFDAVIVCHLAWVVFVMCDNCGVRLRGVVVLGDGPSWIYPNNVCDFHGAITN